MTVYTCSQQPNHHEEIRAGHWKKCGKVSHNRIKNAIGTCS